MKRSSHTLLARYLYPIASSIVTAFGVMSGCWEDEALRYLGFFSPSSKSGYMPYVTIPLCSVLPVRVVSVQHCFGSDHTDLLTGSADVQLHDEDKDNAISVMAGKSLRGRVT